MAKERFVYSGHINEELQSGKTKIGLNFEADFLVKVEQMNYIWEIETEKELFDLCQSQLAIWSELSGLFEQKKFKFKKKLTSKPK
jgi:hypothetical protein